MDNIIVLTSVDGGRVVKFTAIKQNIKHFFLNNNKTIPVHFICLCMQCRTRFPLSIHTVHNVGAFFFLGRNEKVLGRMFAFSTSHEGIFCCVKDYLHH